jgi:cation diffusion facilitator family transporter
MTDQANREIRRVTWLGIVINITLTVLKVIVGMVTRSMGLFADGIHSLSDLATDAAVLLGVRYGSKEPDLEHPFGHGRMETFSAAVVALVLAIVGAGMIYAASMEIVRMNQRGQETVTISIAVIWIALLSVISKEALYQITRITAVRCHSAAVYANAWHHRSDALSSIAVIIGAAAVRFFNYPHGDQLAAIAVGLMIMLVAANIFGNCIGEFSERAVDKQTVKQIETILSGQPQIAQWHKLRTRSVGREIFLDVHILVNPELKITEAHTVSEKLESALQTQLSRPVNVMVHIEPDLPELRR